MRRLSELEASDRGSWEDVYAQEVLSLQRDGSLGARLAVSLVILPLREV